MQASQAVAFLNGCTATNLFAFVHEGTKLVASLAAFGLIPGQVPESVKVKSVFFATSASSMVNCMKRSSPQGPYFHFFLQTSVSHLQHLPPTSYLGKCQS